MRGCLSILLARSKPEIASLHERIGQGGNWKEFREEIVALHAGASTEEEYVTLLETYEKLVAIGKLAYDEETWAKLLPVTTGEYRFLLSKEATGDGLINPVLLERVTRREVEAGRLHSDDDFRAHAVAGASVLGDSAELTAHKCKQGDWFFYGMVSASILAAGLALIPLSPLWLIALGFLVCGFLNERERKRIKKTIVARRS